PAGAPFPRIAGPRRDRRLRPARRRSAPGPTPLPRQGGARRRAAAPRRPRRRARRLPPRGPPGPVPRGPRTPSGGRVGGLSREQATFLLRGQGVRELAQVAGEHLVEVVRGEVHPVIGHPALGEVVGADLLGALAGPDLQPALRGDLRLLLGELLLVQASA